MTSQNEGRFLRVAGLSLVPLREERWLLWLFFLAFVIRAVYVIPHAEIPTINDMGVYHQLAMNLLSGKGYISQLEPYLRSCRAPGYPFFLAAVYFIFGQNALVVLLLQSLMGALTCVFIYLIGRECFGHRIGLIAGLICAVDPELIHWTAKMLTEPMGTFLLALLVLLCVRLTKSRRVSLAVGAGLVAGYGALVLPSILLFIPFLILYLLFSMEAAIRKCIILLSVLLVVCALVMLPWTVRNYMIHRAIIPVRSLTGMWLFVGIPPTDTMIEATEYDGIEALRDLDLSDWEYLDRGMHVLPNGYDMFPELIGRESPYQLPPDFDELEQSRLGYRRFLEYVQEDPVRYGKLLITKLSMIFRIIPKQYSAELNEDYGFGRFDIIVRLYSMVFLLVTFVFGSLGLIVTFRRRGPTILLDSVLLYHIIMQLIFRPTLRYFLPGLVLSSLFTASGLEILGRLKSLLSSQRRKTLVRLRVWGVFMVLFAFNTFYHVVILRWDRVMWYWNHLIATLM